MRPRPRRRRSESGRATDADAVRRAADTEIESLRRAAETEADAARASAEAAQRTGRGGRGRPDLPTPGAPPSANSRPRSRGWPTPPRPQLAAGPAAAAIEREAELDTALTQLAGREPTLDGDGGRTGASCRAEPESEPQRSRRSLAEQAAALERLAGLTADRPRTNCSTAVEATARRDAASLVRTIEAEARAEGTDRARAIVVEAVQRVASEQTTETVVSVLHLPSDEMKGRIIGREGRNIRAFESVTGVNVIIDDTPEAVLLSCFDPVRREIGRITLEKLVLDGRIHPHRIEEIYETAKVEVDELCLRAARDALADVGITDLDERLIPTLGRLKYRTSYGQNVLGHLIETAHIAGIMAGELGLEPALIKRVGVPARHRQGAHPRGRGQPRDHRRRTAAQVRRERGGRARRRGPPQRGRAADRRGGADPGRRRLLGGPARAPGGSRWRPTSSGWSGSRRSPAPRPGVERVFAMQAGREVRVMVLPNEVDDLAAGVIAREVAKQIEDELTYPGQIRVTVVRESRATEVAH